VAIGGIDFQWRLGIAVLEDLLQIDTQESSDRAGLLELVDVPASISGSSDGLFAVVFGRICKSASTRKTNDVGR
jgi:hypothetical protein